MIREKLLKQGIIGEEQFLTQNGRFVYEDDGRKALTRKTNSNVTIELAKRYLPEWQTPDGLETTERHTDAYIDNIPIQFAIVFDIRLCTDEEIADLKSYCFTLKRTA